jgi:hypothetical protein
VPTKALNQAAKRNAERFPEDFMFRLSQAEAEALNRSQLVTGCQKRRYSRFPPYAFTEHGAMIAAMILNSPRAVESAAEWVVLRSQSVILRTGRGQHRKYLPYAFTEQGVAMLSSVLNSKHANAINIEITRAFVELRDLLSSNRALARRFAQVEPRLDKKLTEHDEAIAAIFSAIRQLMGKLSTH